MSAQDEQREVDRSLRQESGQIANDPVNLVQHQAEQHQYGGTFGNTGFGDCYVNEEAHLVLRFATSAGSRVFGLHTAGRPTISWADSDPTQRRIRDESRVSEMPSPLPRMHSLLKSVAASLAQLLIGGFHHSNFDTSRSEDHCQLKVSFIGEGTTHRNSYLDVRYRPDTQEIWYKSALLGERISLRPCVVDGRVCTATETQKQQLN